MPFRIYEVPSAEKCNEEWQFLLEGRPVPLREARVSAVPFNRRWPGHQRGLEQTELVPFAAFELDGPVQVTVKPPGTFQHAIVRPLSKGVVPQTDGRHITFALREAGAYTLELDGHHHALHIFADPPKDYGITCRHDNTLYFGKGLHEAGMITLKSGQTVLIDEGAVVYACIHAKNADNIKILGKGILDNSKNQEQILFELKKTGDGSVDSGNAKRIHTVQLEYCNNIEIDGITIRDSLVYNIRPVCCNGLSINNVKLIGNWRFNSDGIDLHNCIHTTIRNCFLRTYDDAICVKGFDYRHRESDRNGGRNDYSSMDDVLIEKCVIWCDWGRALEIGAETRAEEIKNITFRDCDIIRSTHVAMDVQNVDYADVHDIVFENIRVEYDPVCQAPAIQGTDQEAFVEDTNSRYLPALMSSSILKHHEYSAGGARRGKNHDILFKDIQVTATRMPPSSFGGYDEAHQTARVKIENLRLNGKKLTTLTEAMIALRPFANDITIQ
ncbi:MAG: glycosyl hydrolase family 28 protein [Lentisphaeria bacterium]